MKAIVGYVMKDKKMTTKETEALAFNGRAAFEAFMEGAAMMLDMVGSVEYTYVTQSGNTVHVLMDSP